VIGDGAFLYCAKLASISLPVAETFGYKPFDGCRKLTSITLPNTIAPDVPEATTILRV